MITSCDLIDAITTVRATKVDNCGKPISGPNAVVSSCFSSLAQNVVLDETDDKIYKAPNGTLCGVKRGCPALLGYDIEFAFYQVSPQIVDVLTGNPIVVDNLGEPVGNDSCQINCNTGFALEYWVDLIGATCTTTGAQRYLYGIIPWITNAYIGDLELGADTTTFTLNGSTRAGGQWGVGPYNVVLNGAAPGTPGPMLTPLGATCHRRSLITTVAPPVPDPDCEYVTVPVVP